MKGNERSATNMAASSYGEAVLTRAAEETTQRSIMLPPGLDTEIFDQEQLEYLADYYQAEVMRHLRIFYDLLRTSEPGEEPSPKQVYVNAALLANLFGLNEARPCMPWRKFAAEVRVRHDFLYQSLARMKTKLRSLCPRAVTAYDRQTTRPSKRKEEGEA